MTPAVATIAVAVAVALESDVEGLASGRPSDQIEGLLVEFIQGCKCVRFVYLTVPVVKLFA